MFEICMLIKSNKIFMGDKLHQFIVSISETFSLERKCRIPARKYRDQRDFWEVG
jgi:hypothetical protein